MPGTTSHAAHPHPRSFNEFPGLQTPDLAVGVPCRSWPDAVALFATCLIDALFPDAGRATVELLERLGQALRLAPLMRFVRRGGPPPLSRWTTVRDLPQPPRRSFRDWWVKEHERL